MIWEILSKPAFLLFELSLFALGYAAGYASGEYDDDDDSE